jgi:hypothetical protein
VHKQDGPAGRGWGSAYAQCATRCISRVMRQRPGPDDGGHLRNTGGQGRMAGALARGRLPRWLYTVGPICVQQGTENRG